MPDDLVARLEALGGMLTGAEPSKQGSYEIVTPAGVTEKLAWVSPSALAHLLDAWEAAGICGERLAVCMARIAREMREAEEVARALLSERET
jgi:hypothetical protein